MFVNFCERLRLLVGVSTIEATWRLFPPKECCTYGTVVVQYHTVDIQTRSSRWFC